MENRHILVTGGARGIGRAIVDELLRKNYKVSFLYYGSQDTADAMVESASERGHDLKAYRCDVKDYTSVNETVKKIAEKRGAIYGLVNNAGITDDCSLFLMDKSRWDSVLDTNLNGARCV